MHRENPDDMRARMGPEVYAEWLEWMNRRGIGPSQDDYRLRFMISALGTMFGSKKRLLNDEAGVWTPNDFLLPWEARYNTGTFSQGLGRSGETTSRSGGRYYNAEIVDGWEVPPEEDRLAPLALYKRRSMTADQSIQYAKGLVRQSFGGMAIEEDT